jgi:peptidoglycan hydrolase-like protein with peptidoglycan-binding domain
MLPRMTGEDVKEAQRLLEKNPYGNFAPGPVTGTFGLLTAQASARAKRALGYPPNEIVGTFGAALRDYLSGRKKLPRDYQARRLARRAATGFRSPGLEARRDVHPDA